MQDVDAPTVPFAGGHRRRWRLLVPLTSLGAGLLFATTAVTAHGTDLRAGRRSQLTDLISSQRHQIEARERVASGLRSAVAGATGRTAARSTTVAGERRRAAALATAAGLTPLSGPSLTVSLDDAPRPSAGQHPASDNPDDLVVHQQDVQSVVNALWAGGAEAMTLMGERVVSTSAVRCVGNTLLLQGRVYSPPFVVTAVGDAARMRGALAVEPGVVLLRQYVDRFDLGFSVRSSPQATLPAYAGSLELPHVAGAQP